ncbi:hypothetical protein MKW98_018096, partial [Papaver atlanticum]
VKEVKEPLNDCEIKEGKRKELGNGSEDDHGPEMVDMPLPNHEVRVVDNGTYRNVDNVPVRNVDNGKKWFDDSDFEDFLAAANLEVPELFPKLEHELQVIADDRIEEGLEFPDKTAFKKHLRKYC